MVSPSPAPGRRTGAAAHVGQPELVDIVDAYDRPLAVMPVDQAHQQLLYHRAVLVLVHNNDHKLYLQKRSPSKTLYPECWDLSATGHVRAGEAREDAAKRELREELNLEVKRLVHLRSVAATPFTGYEFVTLYSAGRLHAEPEPAQDEITEGMYVDRTELGFLVENFRDMLTPALTAFWEQDLLFPHRP